MIFMLYILFFLFCFFSFTQLAFNHTMLQIIPSLVMLRSINARDRVQVLLETLTGKRRCVYMCVCLSIFVHNYSDIVIFLKPGLRAINFKDSMIAMC